MMSTKPHAVWDSWRELMTEVSRVQVDRLLEECGYAVPSEAVAYGRILGDLAGACVEALIDEDLGAPLRVAPHGGLRSHLDFPIRLPQRVIAALHLYGALEDCRWSSTLASLTARGLLLDGDPVPAAEMSVLGIALGSSSGSAHTRLGVSVLAAALCRLGLLSLAEPLHLELWAAGVEIEAWRDAELWAESGPWTDGAYFAPWVTFPPPTGSSRSRDRLERREKEFGTEYLFDFAKSPSWQWRSERFGLHQYGRRRRLGIFTLLNMLDDLEDEAIQKEWEFL